MKQRGAKRRIRINCRRRAASQRFTNNALNRSKITLSLYISLPLRTQKAKNG